MRRVQILRDTSASVNAFVGLPGELQECTDTHELRTHDGSTPGGFRLLTKQQLDAAYQALNGDLTAISSLASTPGFLTRIAANTWAMRNFADSPRLKWTNPSGGVGNPSVDFQPTIDLTGVTFNNGTFNGNGAGLSNVQYRFVAKTADYLIAPADDRAFLVMTSAVTTGVKTFSFAAFATYPNNFQVKIKSLNPRTIIVPAVGENIEGLYTLANPLRLAQNSAVIIIKDASGWYILDDQVERVGDFKQSGHTNVEGFWILADGRALSRTDYANLFADLGTTWGIGDGATTFNIPNVLGRTLVGAGGAGAGGLTARALGVLLGTESEVLDVTKIPAHSHPVTDPGHGHGVTDPGHGHNLNLNGLTDVFGHGGAANQTVPLGATLGFSVPTIQNALTGLTVNNAATGISTQNVGGGLAHNNMQPSAAAAFYIRA